MSRVNQMQLQGDTSTTQIAPDLVPMPSQVAMDRDGRMVAGRDTTMSGPIVDVSASDGKAGNEVLHMSRVNQMQLQGKSEESNRDLEPAEPANPLSIKSSSDAMRFPAGDAWEKAGYDSIPSKLSGAVNPLVMDRTNRMHFRSDPWMHSTEDNFDDTDITGHRFGSIPASDAGDDSSPWYESGPSDGLEPLPSARGSSPYKDHATVERLISCRPTGYPMVMSKLKVQKSKSTIQPLPVALSKEPYVDPDKMAARISCRPTIRKDAPPVAVPYIVRSKSAMQGLPTALSREPYVDPTKLQAAISCRNTSTRGGKLSPPRKHSQANFISSLNEAAAARAAGSKGRGLKPAVEIGGVAKIYCDVDESKLHQLKKKDSKIGRAHFRVGKISSSTEDLDVNRDTTLSTNQAESQVTPNKGMAIKSFTAPASRVAADPTSYPWHEGTEEEQTEKMERRRNELLQVDDLESQPLLVEEWLALLLARETRKTPSATSEESAHRSTLSGTSAAASAGTAFLRATMKAAQLTAKGTVALASLTAKGIKREYTSMKKARAEAKAQLAEAKAKGLTGTLKGAPQWWKETDKRKKRIGSAASTQGAKPTARAETPDTANTLVATVAPTATAGPQHTTDTGAPPEPTVGAKVTVSSVVKRLKAGKSTAAPSDAVMPVTSHKEVSELPSTDQRQALLGEMSDARTPPRPPQGGYTKTPPHRTRQHSFKTPPRQTQPSDQTPPRMPQSVNITPTRSTRISARLLSRKSQQAMKTPPRKTQGGKQAPPRSLHESRETPTKSTTHATKAARSLAWLKKVATSTKIANVKVVRKKPKEEKRNGPTMEQTLAAQKVKNAPVQTVTMQRVEGMPLGLSLSKTSALKIESLNLVAEGCGLRRGDTVVRVNNKEYSSSEDAMAAMLDASGALRISVIREGVNYTYIDV